MAASETQTKPVELEEADLPDAVWDNVLATCERFEKSWSIGSRVEDYLGDAGSHQSRLLLKQLLSIDLEKRVQIGASIDYAAYARRFPDSRQIVHQAFASIDIAAESAGNVETVASSNPTDATRVANHHFPEIDGYEVLGVIGAGGMGTVYKAQQKQPDRTVAVKMISSRFATAEQLQRFRVEADLTAQLDHPNIVSIYEFGDLENSPYFSLQYIKGQNLNQLHEEPVTGHQAAEYVRAISRAVQYAHEVGILHRDIKPSNILVHEKDRTPFLTDFGIAKSISSDSGLTESHQILGTPSFMSPEQARGDVMAVDERSDVYSLGAVLYSLVTGHPPFKAATREETCAQVINNEPVRPRQSNPQIDRDLEKVCLKCLEKDKGKRYSSAQALAEDLDRYLKGEPVQARLPGVAERWYRWCLRNRAQAFAIVSLFSFLLVSAILGSYLAVVTSTAAKTEKSLREDADISRLRAERSRHRSDVGIASLQYQQILDDSRMSEATRYSPKPMFLTGADFNVRKAPESASGWETRWLDQFRGEAPKLEGRLAEGNWGIVDLAVCPNRKTAISVDASGLMILWDLDSGRMIKKYCEGRLRTGPDKWLHHYQDRDPVESASDWGPCYIDVDWMDDQRFVAASTDGTGSVFNAVTNVQEHIIPPDQPLCCVAAGGGGLLFADDAGGLSLRSPRGEENAKSDAGHGAATVIRWLPNGRGWIVGYESGAVAVLHAQSLEIMQQFDVPGPVWSLDTIEQGNSLLIVVGAKNRVPMIKRLTDSGVKNETELQPSQLQDPSAVHQVKFSIDGSTLFSADEFGHVTQWSLESRTALWSERLTAPGPRLPVSIESDDLPLAFRRSVSAIRELAANQTLLTAGQDIVVKLWSLPSQSETASTELVTKFGANPQIEFDRSDDNVIWGIGTDGVLRLIGINQDKEIANRQAHQGSVPGIAVAQDVDLVATVGGDNSIGLWRRHESQIVPTLAKSIDHSTALISVTLTNNGELVAAVDDNAHLRVWNTDDGVLVFAEDLNPTVDSNGNALRNVTSRRPRTGKVEFNRDGSLLAAFGTMQSAAVFSTRPFRRLKKSMFISGSGGTAMVWNPNHERVVVCADDYPRYITTSVDSDFRHLERRPFERAATCVAMAITPDAKRIVCLEEGGRIVFVDTEEHYQMLALTHPRGLDSDLSFNYRGNCMAIAGQDGSVEVMRVDASNPTPGLPIVDQSDNWTQIDLVTPTSLAPRTDRRAIAFDSLGQINMLLVMSNEEDHQFEGELHFLRSSRDDRRGQLREIIRVGTSFDERYYDFRAMAMVIDSDNRPQIVFRRRHSAEGTWDGTLHHARRDNGWTTSVVHSHGNQGFYPFIRLDSQDRIEEIRHFSFDGFVMMRSYASSSVADEWNFEYLGRAGDGLSIEHVETDDGVVHGLFHWNPVNSVATPRVYTQHSKDGFVREVVDPMAQVGSLRTTSDGDVLVLAREEGSVRLLRREKTDWRTYAELPEDVEGGFQVAASGDIFVGPKWDKETGQLLLWHQVNDQWRIEIISNELFESDPNTLYLILDQQRRPCVVVGRTGEPYGWIKMITPGQ